MNTLTLERTYWIFGIVSSIVALIVWLWPSTSPSVAPAAPATTISSTQFGTTNIQVAGGGTIVINAPPVTSQLSSPTPDAASRNSALPNQGPSFDCNKATYKSEKIICSSRELGILDLALANAYRDVVARITPDGKRALRNQQNYWLRNIREQCHDISCLRSLYEERISYLKELLR